MVKLITDSTNDLNKELLAELDIEVIPLYVNFGVDSYKDGMDITTEELYKIVDEKGELPKTSAVSVADFIKVFFCYRRYYSKKWMNIFTGRDEIC